MQRKREMAHPVPTKAFLKGHASPEAAMLFVPFGCTQPPPLSCPFCWCKPNPRTLPEVTSQPQLQLKSLVVKGLTIPANYSPKDTIAKTASQCQQLLQALGHDKSFNDYAKQSSTNSLLKGICYFDNYIFHQSCNC